MESKEIHPWLEVVGRVGFVAKGVLYVILGVLALQISMGMGGQTAGLSEVLKEIRNQADPFGIILLGIVAAGLLCHTIFRFAQSILDPENKGTDFITLVNRFGYFTSVIMYGGLVYLSTKIIFQIGSTADSSQKPEKATATILAQPFGKWLVIAAGAGIIISGLFQLYLSISANFMEKLDQSEMDEKEKNISKWVSRIGLAARSVVFCILGIFLIQAAINYNPSQAGGIGEALKNLLHQPYGIVWLGIVSVGMVGYGGYCLVLARFRSFKVENNK